MVSPMDLRSSPPPPARRCLRGAVPGLEHAADRRPSVVIIYGDDVGFGDLGCYGATQIPPEPRPPRGRRAALHRRALLRGDLHAQPLLAPHRGPWLPARSPRPPPNAPLTIPTDWLTLPRVFESAGYRTAVVGKWHLGLGERGTPVDWNGDVKPGPLELGFDTSFLLPSTNDRVPCVYLDGHRVLGLDPADPLHVGKRPEGFAGTVYPDGKKDRAAMTYYASSHGHDNSVIGGIGRIGFQWGGESALWDDETMADVFVDRARAWLTDRAAAKEPFLLYFSSQDIHVPRTPHPRFQGKSELGYRGDAMVQLDWAAGALMDTLDELGLAEDTIVIFSSDNGPVYDDGYEDGTTVLTSTEESDRGHDGSGPWTGGKYRIEEGGTRVLIVRWPGRVEPGVSDALFGQIDLLASFAALLEVEVPGESAMDSRDHLATLLGDDETGASILVEEARALALRSGDWKLVRRPKGGLALFDLAADPAETTNRLKDEPERAAELTATLEKIRAGEGVRALSR